jgi:hypothetical protein
MVRTQRKEIEARPLQEADSYFSDRLQFKMGDQPRLLRMVSQFLLLTASRHGPVLTIEDEDKWFKDPGFELKKPRTECLE